MSEPSTYARVVRLSLAFTLGVLIILVLILNRLPPFRVTGGGAGIPEPMPSPVVRLVASRLDASKPGQLRSIMGQGQFFQEGLTSSASRNRLDFRFDAPVRIVGVLVSVDDRGMEMVELAVGINADTYGLEARDWLIHTSDTAGGPSTDEQAWFPDGFEVGPGDRVSVVAWLYNSRRDAYWVSPEVILYYEWL